MNVSQNMVASENWRRGLFTFADENKRIFTVTNCPPIIHPIATTTDSDFLANRPVGSLLRPQMSTRKYPELAFLLQKLPIADPLLSRICIDPLDLPVARYDDGWALKDDLRKTWIALEKGLLHISDMLVMFPEESPVGTSGPYAVRAHEHWPPPQDYGYRTLHTSARAAEISIMRAHGAFQVLAARCSLAIALWMFPGPIRGRVPTVSPVRYDSVTATVVPDWIPFLRARGVPSSWIDALCDSVLTDFSTNLRVGTVFDPTDCPWLQLVPVLVAANVPVFILWRSPATINECEATHPYIAVFAPSIGDASQAGMNLPGGRPRVVTLCRDGQTRPLPDYSMIDDNTPPFGPYQLPGESRTEFLARRERYRPDQTRQESSLRKARRQALEAHAETGAPPYLRSRVYLWVRPDLVFPDLNPHWAEYEYRFSIPPAAYRSLWMVHPSGTRRYNSFYDEWDLWFPIGWCMHQEEDTMLRRDLGTTPYRSDAALVPGCGSGPLLDEHELLNPAPEDREICAVDHADRFILYSWYGIQLQSTRAFSGVDYQKWSCDIWHLFGETRERFPPDAATRKCLAGWVSAVMIQDWTLHALEFTWDLDPRHPNYILDPKNADPRLSMSLHHVQCPDRKDDLDNIKRWVLVTFKEDAENQPWSLLTSPMGALLIIRQLAEARTSSDALHVLLCAGIPARTGIWMKEPPNQAMLSRPHLSLRHLAAPWREKGERPTIQDYDVYCQRVLQLCHSPHARAAWLKGGIVWRIMVEVTGKHPQDHTSVTHLEELQNGPSGLTDHYEAVALDYQKGQSYDDTLSKAELDTIAGVVRVYTGRGDQTEDVSWWPKHSAWVRAAGYTGIWSPSDERWFQRRLEAIHGTSEGPLNASEWKRKLKRQKKAGSLWNILEQQAWKFTYRNFDQHQVSQIDPPSPSQDDTLVDVNRVFVRASVFKGALNPHAVLNWRGTKLPGNAEVTRSWDSCAVLGNELPLKRLEGDLKENSGGDDGHPQVQPLLCQYEEPLQQVMELPSAT